MRGIIHSEQENDPGIICNLLNEVFVSIELISMKCPNCSANLELTPGSEKGKCEYCGSTFVVTEFRAESRRKTERFNSAWAERIADLTVRRFKLEHSIDLSEDPEALRRITEESRKAAVELEHEDETTMNIPFIVMDMSHPLHICEDYTRSDMAEAD